MILHIATFTWNEGVTDEEVAGRMRPMIASRTGAQIEASQA
jgi:hypothetical protein